MAGGQKKYFECRSPTIFILYQWKRPFLGQISIKPEVCSLPQNSDQSIFSLDLLKDISFFQWSFLESFSKCTNTQNPIFPSFHIAADAWNQLPADIRTSSSLLKFKDSTRHYTSPGRQLPSVTTVAVSCSQIAYLELLNYMCLLKLRSISPAQTSTFPSRKHRRFLISVCLQPSTVGDEGRDAKREAAIYFSGDELLLWSVSL